MSFEKSRAGSREKSDPLAEYRRALRDNPDDSEALQRLQGELERRGMRGAFVPVETSPEIAKEGAPIPKENRWVEWKMVKDENGVEIPGSIEKILRVKLIAEPVDQQIAKGHYEYDYLSEQLTDAHRAIHPQSDEQELFLPKFDREVETEEIELWFESNGLRGATLQELLTIGSQLPEEQRRVYLSALDEAWRFWGDVPGLGGPRGVRDLHISHCANPWGQDVRPVAARKSV